MHGAETAATQCIISMDDKGNIAFSVCGYMNRGIHEGEVGNAIYYYDREQSIVEEKAFISSSKSPEVWRKSWERWYIILRSRMCSM